MLVGAALVIATLALLVAILAVVRVSWLQEAVRDALKKHSGIQTSHGNDLTRLNSKIDRSQASLRRSLSDLRGEVRRALAEPEPAPQEETTEVVSEEPKPNRRKRRARLNLFERIAADESSIPDDEDKPK